MHKLNWIRDRRLWSGPTYSAVSEGFFLYAGVKNRRCAFAIAVEDQGDNSLAWVIYESDEDYDDVDSAVDAAEAYFFSMASRPKLCQECFTRHEPGKNTLCQQ